MTEKTKHLLAQVEKELEELPEEEQEEIGEELLNTLRRRMQERREDEAVSHPSLDVLRDAQIEGLPSDYSERLDHYLYGADEE
jgi:hypothetical protein